MRDTARRITLLVGTTMRASPGRSLLAFLEPAGKILGRLQGLWIALLVNGIIDRHAAAVAWAVAALVVSVVLDLIAQLVGTSARIALMERIGFAFDCQIAEITGAIPSLEHFERSDYADQLQILRQSRGTLGGALNSLINAGNNLASTAALLIMAGAIEPRLLLLVLTGLPVIVGSRFRYRWNKQGEEEAAPAGRLAQHLTELTTDLDAGMELRTFGLRGEIRRRLQTALRDSRTPVVRAARRSGLLTLVEDIVFALVVTGLLGWLIVDAIHGSVPPGTLVVVVYIAQQVQQMVVGSVSTISNFANNLRAAGRLLWLRDRAAEIGRQYAGKRNPPETLTNGIELEHVSFSYAGAELPSLHDISVRLPAGAVVALVGENGAGKSTVVKLLAGLYRPTDGRVLVDGADLAEFDIAAWREQCSAAFQDFARFEFSAQETVGVGNLPESENAEAVGRALEAAGAADVRSVLPGGLSTQLGSTWAGGVDLSGGQWQKLALGRGLMRRDPLLLIFDEPTANLDAPTEHALFEQYSAAARSATERGAITILVTHRFSTVRAADLILVLSGGRIVEQGSHEELIRADGPYSELYELQARGYR